MRRKLFLRQALRSLYWNIRKFLILWLRSVIFWDWFFYFSNLEVIYWNFLFIGLENSISWNIGVPFSPNLKKAFFWENVRNFFNIRVRKSHFLKYKEFFCGVDFFYFFAFRLKSPLGSCIPYYFLLGFKFGPYIYFK